jgi:hypothetical protein
MACWKAGGSHIAKGGSVAVAHILVISLVISFHFPSLPHIFFAQPRLPGLCLTTHM